MTNSKKLLDTLKLELKNVCLDKKLEHNKLRISSTSDPDERSLIETLYELLLTNFQLDCEEETVVILIHGIRTYAIWQNALKKKIESSLSFKVIPLDYGYWDVFRFWIPIDFIRVGAVKHISEELNIIKRDYPSANIVIVAHSFGTYITGKILQNNSHYQITRLLLCGSILPENFKWDKLYNFKEEKQIVNEVGTKDFWPMLAKSMTFGYGASGTFGFRTHVANDRYHNVDHSGFFHDDMYEKFWIPFIKDGSIIPSEVDTNRDPPPKLATLFSLFTGQLLVLITILIIVPIFIFIFIFI